MDKEKVQELRKKQRLFLNMLLFLYIGILIGLILMLKATREDIYELLGISFLISVVAQWVYKTSPTLALLSTKELVQWERERLGESWRKYYLPGTILRVILAAYFFMQAGLYAGKTPFKYEIPLWYLIVIPFVLIVVANVNMTWHSRRIDTKTMDELKQYSQEKMLFTKIFAIVSSVMILIGFTLVLWLR